MEAGDWIDVGAPGWLIPRARSVFEIDAVIAAGIVARLTPLASHDKALRIAEAAVASVDLGRDEAPSPEIKVAALSALADFDDYCGNGVRRPWWWPAGPGPIEQVDNPLFGPTLRQAVELIRTAGSEALQKTLGEALLEIGRVPA